MIKLKSDSIGTFVFIFGLFFILLPQLLNAQVSADASRLLRAARIQVLNQPENAQDFTLQMLNGERVSLSSYRGKVVFLNFWATWCPPCRQEMPSMEVLYQRYKEHGLEMLAVNLRENPNEVRQFIQENGYTFPVLLDLDGRVGARYGVRGIPTTLIIDRQGRIIGRLVGSIYWDTSQVFEAFEALLNNTF
ncbi:MAG: TlpA family protein disulfide reductase [Treponema sp.]|jgi:peroxiredoxin|nr:TlpA family protein disulfide reductase [Treponema sp.]